MLWVWLCAALVISPAMAGVYKWIDADGRVHFSDHPPTYTKTEEIKIHSYSGATEVTTDGEGFGARTVKILTTTWCGQCRKAKAFLTGKHISFTEYDVEKSELGKIEYRRLKGRGVPIILVGNQRMNGFNSKRLEKMLKNVGY
jgi:glutaredoxin